jgi:hypothetical protein
VGVQWYSVLFSQPQLETHGRQDSGYILMIVIPDPAPAVDMLLAWPFL